MDSSSNPSSKDLLARRILINPFLDFLKIEAAGGILLLLCTAIALVWANSPWASTYQHLLHTDFTIGFGHFKLEKGLEHWINDGLMAIFFLVVGLEIKREFLVGELAQLKQAVLPIAAAIGGMVVPALIYACLNQNSGGMNGWGIPMATDIAFAIGILTLFGNRVPLSLKVFLTALAIVDDLGAVLVIAIFYTAQLKVFYLAIGGAILALLFAINRLEVRHPLVYCILGVFLWFAFLKSGVHATIAGVLLALTIPSRTQINVKEFLSHAGNAVDKFRAASPEENISFTNKGQHAALHRLKFAHDAIESPMQRLEHMLLPWVNFFIMPVFALANAGVPVSGDIFATLAQPVSLGIILGLFFGKQIGVTLFAYAAVKLKLAVLPRGASWMSVYSMSCIAGIGFTMSLFVANLAFGKGHAFLDMSKISILFASSLAGIYGCFMIWWTTRGNKEPLSSN